MKNILCLFFFLPLVLCAQLDRVHTRMRVAEFQTAFPEAKRDYKAEAYHVEQPDTLEGLRGTSRWSIQSDTVNVYRFVSETRLGPFALVPNSDSSAVHELKIAAETYRKKFQAQFGEPSALISIPFSEVGAGSMIFAYRALWTFGYDDFIFIEVACDGEPVYENNKPNRPAGPRRTSYQLLMEVRHRSSFTQINYGMGQSVLIFYQNNPSLKKQQPQNPEMVFTFEDSIGDGGHWKFIFTNDSLKSLSYNVYAVTTARSTAETDAYLQLKLKAEQLMKEAERSFGAADSMYNKMTPQYMPTERYETYSRTHLYGEWRTTLGPAIIRYVEKGGGKNPDTGYRLSFWLGTE